MNKLRGLFVGVGRLGVQQIGLRFRKMHISAALNASVFIKKQKKVDPEIAKIRENRKRKKLEKEIRQLKKHGKTPKPVEEMQLDVKSAKTVKERYRPAPQLTEEELDRRCIAVKDYSKSRAALMRRDDEWIRNSIRLQDKALSELKHLSPGLYEAAVQADTNIINRIIFEGPTLTPPLPNFDSPDGDYIDVTRTWT